jgi:hypothetical protein
MIEADLLQPDHPALDLLSCEIIVSVCCSALTTLAFSWRYSSDKNRLVIIATASAEDVRAVSTSNGA